MWAEEEEGGELGEIGAGFLAGGHIKIISRTNPLSEVGVLMWHLTHSAGKMMTLGQEGS